MRVALLVSALVTAGCAGQPNNAAPPATRYVTATGEQVNQIQLTTPDGEIDAKRAAEAKKRGYTLVNTNGETLFCRSDLKTGSHLQRDTVCLTASQLDRLHEQTQQALQNVRPMHPAVGQ
jgi:hypothetical protein